MKSIWLCLCLILAMGVQAQKKEKVLTSSMKCEISGQVDKDSKAIMAYLLKANGRTMVPVDSALIKDGSFVLSEDATEVPEVRYVSFKGVSMDPVKVFLDADDLVFRMNKTTKEYEAAGSVANDAYARMQEETYTLRKQMDEAYARYKDKALNEEQHKKAEKDYDKYEQEAIKIEEKYLKENIGNVLGLHILLDNCYALGPVAEQYFYKLSPVFKEDAAYKRLERFVENEKKCLPGDDYHDVVLKTPEGVTKKLSDYIQADKFTIIDFWASWCGPCRAEMPNMVKIYKEFGNRGVEIVGISLDKDAAAWKKAIKDMGMTWPQLSDLKYWQSAAAEVYGVQSIPMTVIVSPNGRILKKNMRGDELYQAASRWAQ